MPVPHDYYDYGSDEPHLHNRDHARPYTEPDWQAHAAGHQLPVLSTIGRGPQGDGLLVANFENNGTSFSFDIVSDVTGEPIAKIGPIPSGRVKVDVSDGKITFTTNKLGPNNTIAKDVVSVDVPQGEDGARIYMYPDKLTRTSADMYTLPGSKLTAYNRRGYTKRPDVRVGDVVIGQVYDGTDGYLFFGTVADATAQEQLVVIAQTIIPIAALVGPKGDKGDKGATGADGAKGDPGTNGTNGVSCTHEWNGTTLTIHSASGTSSADLKGDTGETGATGADGKSAYQIAVDNGYRGSQADWLASLKGPKGDDGSIGPTGPTGPQGPSGGTSVPVRMVKTLEASDLSNIVLGLPANISCNGYGSDNLLTIPPFPWSVVDVHVRHGVNGNIVLVPAHLLWPNASGSPQTVKVVAEGSIAAGDVVEILLSVQIDTSDATPIRMKQYNNWPLLYNFDDDMSADI